MSILFSYGINIMHEDKIYLKALKTVPKFKFDHQISNIFDDMINRSIPGYQSILKIIEYLSFRYTNKNENVYDLGCSLGASSLALLNGANNRNCNFFAIDSSSDMIEKSRINISSKYPNEIVHFIHNDIRNIKFSNTSFVSLNFTLQFLPIDERFDLIKSIKENMNSGGILILSEKINFNNPIINKQKIDAHEKFKSKNNYTNLEIKQKKIALKGILFPEKKEKHIKRLNEIGFKKIYHVFQSINFMSMVIINE